MDVTPLIPNDKYVINKYGDNSITVNNEKFLGNLIITPNKILKWEITDFASLTIENFRPLVDEKLEILLLGCGTKHLMLNNSIKYGLKSLLPNISIEVMTTGAACRTYNILLAEGRIVGCALIAV
ncbi:MAG: Mth938-like domain-containing protein [Alphaproteobacteria bacterium]